MASEPVRKSKLNEREKKQAVLPVTIFGIELVSSKTLTPNKDNILRN